MTKALYAFSGDPITYGHIDIVQRAAKGFSEVIVAIGSNPKKEYLFSLEERKEMAKRSLSHMPNVQVDSFQGLMVDYAYRHGIEVVVKGIRNAADVEFELTLHHVGDSQRLGIDTFFLPAKADKQYISSSAVKELQSNQGFVHEFVPLHVKESLEERLNGQYIVGITGEIGVGKSYVGQQLVLAGRNRGIQVHNLELDTIAHNIGDSHLPVHKELHLKIAQAFGEQVLSQDGRIQRKILGEMVFGDPHKLATLNSLMKTPLLTELRQEMYGKKGLLLINAALLAESDWLHLCNNNVLLVTAPKDVQRERLRLRGLSQEQIENRLSSQYTVAKKREVILEKQAEHGTLWEYDNLVGSSIDDVFTQIILKQTVLKMRFITDEPIYNRK